MDWSEVRKGVRMCLAKLPLLDAREDIEQDAMLRAITFQHTYKGESSLSTWGYSIARNVAMDFFNKRKSDLLVFVDTSALEMPASAIECVEADPLEALLNDDVELFQLIISRMSRVRIGVLVDRDLHAMDYTSIAAKHGIPIGTVRSTLSRARQTLHDTIADMYNYLDERQIRNVMRSSLERAQEWLHTTQAP